MYQCWMQSFQPCYDTGSSGVTKEWGGYQFFLVQVLDDQQGLITGRFTLFCSSCRSFWMQREQ